MTTTQPRPPRLPCTVEPLGLTAPPVLYLVAEQRDGEWMLGEWQREFATLAEAQETAAVWRALPGGYEVGVLAVSVVEAAR